MTDLISKEKRSYIMSMIKGKNTKPEIIVRKYLLRYEVKHSYILELKYLSSKDTEEKAETQWKEAVEQIKKYAAAPKVRQLIHDTKLHCIVMQIRGSELKRMEEVQ